ncbi:MAG: T9SS type A sorting domain-containing protein [Ignavibacteria bacterium]|nr:T9SS type A sorting domain-containing protein [Ignavibacteria bacterium]
MKKTALLIILLIISNIAFGQTYQWTFVSYTPSPSPVVNSLCVVNQNIIWIACDAAGGGAKVYRSLDGGLNWTLRVNGLANQNSYGIYALDSLTCFVGNTLGSLYRTTDGGLNWTQVLAVSGSFTNGIKMFNSDYGVYYGDPTGSGQPYQFRVTTNGGLNWNLVPGAPIAGNEYGVINAWDWTDSSHFWIGSANITAGATNAKIYRTATGYYGTWLSTTVSGTGGTSGCYYQAVGFINNNQGMIGSSGGDIKKTTDGGTTFLTVTPPSGLGPNSIMNMTGLKDASNTIRVSIVDTGGAKMFSTTNLGTTWINEPLPIQASSQTINHIQFIDATLGYAAFGQSGGVGGIIKYASSSGITNTNNEIPNGYILKQNYPNPFNPSTNIEFSIPKSGFVTLKIYNSLGKEVDVLVNGNISAGNYTITYTPEYLVSGIYYYRLSADNNIITKKMILVK